MNAATAVKVFHKEGGDVCPHQILPSMKWLEAAHDHVAVCNVRSHVVAICWDIFHLFHDSNLCCNKSEVKTRYLSKHKNASKKRNMQTKIQNRNTHIVHIQMKKSQENSIIKHNLENPTWKIIWNSNYWKKIDLNNNINHIKTCITWDTKWGSEIKTRTDTYIQ